MKCQSKNDIRFPTFGFGYLNSVIVFLFIEQLVSFLQLSVMVAMLFLAFAHVYGII